MTDKETIWSNMTSDDNEVICLLRRDTSILRHLKLSLTLANLLYDARY